MRSTTDDYTEALGFTVEECGKLIGILSPSRSASNLLTIPSLSSSRPDFQEACQPSASEMPSLSSSSSLTHPRRHHPYPLIRWDPMGRRRGDRQRRRYRHRYQRCYQCHRRQSLRFHLHRQGIDQHYRQPRRRQYRWSPLDRGGKVFMVQDTVSIDIGVIELRHEIIEQGIS